MVLTLVDYERLSKRYFTLKFHGIRLSGVGRGLSRNDDLQVERPGIPEPVNDFRKIMKIIQVCFYWNILIKNNEYFMENKAD